MRLSEARLCLDCEEIHADTHCPMCASESFAFIKRWVTSEKRPRSASPTATKQPKKEEPSETLATYRALLAPSADEGSGAARLLRGGAVGLALLGAAGWLLQRNSKQNGSSIRPPSGADSDGS